MSSNEVDRIWTSDKNPKFIENTICTSLLGNLNKN
jgi:hypothetical protein